MREMDPIMEDLRTMLAAAEAERDYYRQVAERLGRKTLSDAQDYSRVIRNLRHEEERLRRNQNELESTIAARTAELVRSNRELYQSQEMLRESEEMYRLLTLLAPNAITVADISGTIRLLNPKALQLYGHRQESEAIGVSIFEWVSPESMESAQRGFEELFLTGSVANLELQLRRHGGPDFAGEVSASILHDSLGRPKLIILMSSDLTFKKLAEEERLKIQKTEAIGTLAGGIAHDFNNLLQGVFGYISLARLNLHDQDSAGRLLNQADQAIGQAVNLTSQLLTFAKGGNPLKRKTVLRSVIESAAKLALSGSNSGCVMNIAEDLWATEADEGQIGQVVQNIVLNASQAMPRSGTVEISADNIETSAEVAAVLPAGGRFIRICFKDNGTGIQPQDLAKIFDPYFTTKQNGSGLGLATSYSIVKRHGGTITASSEPGTGTVVCVYLPAATLEASQTGGLPITPEARVATPVRAGLVLIMDDDELIRSVSGKMIEAIGHEVAYASNGEEAILKTREARESGNPFDVVVLDLTVRGGMGGEEAIRKIREISPQVKAIVSSGYSDSFILSEYQAYGFDAYLNKPYTISALRDSLAALLAACHHSGSFSD
jgi:two-component system, cell cycle sensor histidine kinase and response regulator CckA